MPIQLPLLAQGGLGETLIFVALIFGVLYFLILRPQKKKERQRKEMLSDIKRGDRVVTIGGIQGELTGVKEHHVILLVDPERGTSLKINRSAVHRVITRESDEEE